MATNDDGQLFVLDSFGPFYLYLVDLERRTVAGQYGREGEGPGELSGSSSLQLVRGPHPQLWVMQASRRLNTRYDVTGVPVFREEKHFESRGALYESLMLPAGMIASGNFRSTGALMKGDSTFRNPRPWGQAPYRPEDLPPVLVFDANWAYIATDPAETRIVTVFRYAPEVQILDTTGVVLHRITLPGGVGHPYVLSPTHAVNFDSDSSKIAYLAVAASDSAIFAVYCGCHGAMRRSESGPLQLQVFRWDGTFVGSQTIAKQITALTVSRDGRTVYLATYHPEPTVTVLTLKY